MSSKKTTDSTTNTNSTTTPNVPTWISQPSQALAGQISALQAGGSAKYAPGVSNLEQQAATAAGNLTGSPYYGQAAQAANATPNAVSGGAIDPITGQSLLTNLSSYYTPFKDQVLNPVLADYDAQSGMTRAAQAAAAAKGGAFGGSRYGIQEAQTEADLARGRASTEGGLLNSMYTQATGLSAQDAAARQAAMTSNQGAQENTAGRVQAASEANQQAQLAKAGLLSGIGTAQGADTRANVALQGQLGQQETELQNEIKQYPLKYQAQLESLLSGLNPQMYVGSNVTGTSSGHSTETSDPGLLGYLGAGMQLAGMASGFGAPSSIASLFGGGASAAFDPASAALGVLG